MTIHSLSMMYFTINKKINYRKNQCKKIFQKHKSLKTIFLFYVLLLFIACDSLDTLPSKEKVEKPVVTPPPPAVLKGFLSIVAINTHTMVVKKDGTLWGWGDNGKGQLPNVNDTSPTIPMKIGENTWKTVFNGIGREYVVAIRGDSTLWAWGNNEHGRLGNGKETTSHFEITPPQQVGDATMQTWKWKGGSTSEDYAAAIREDGTLWSWGFNWGSQLGTGNTKNHTIPQHVGDATMKTWKWKSVSTGADHVLAIRADDTLWAWGVGTYGELGDGISGRDADGGWHKSKVPTQVGNTAMKDWRWKSASAGNEYSLAIREDGTLWAWGKNTKWNGDITGQLGIGNRGNQNIPQQVGKNTWKAVYAGEHHGLGIQTDGTLWSWGSNIHARLGRLGDATVPQQAGNESMKTWKWKRISAGWAHSIAQREDDTLWTWGNNGWGQLGNASATGRRTPVQVKMIE